MVDFIMGPFGAALIYASFAGLLLVVFMAFANVLFGLSDSVRRYGSIISCALMAGFPVWMAMFYGSTLFHADFDGDWRGIAFASVMTLAGCWLVSTPILAIRRILRLSSMNDI